ncbi:MAG: hypothetical protein JSU88_08110 [Nitrospinaceae bacterium]|nr:MAG: hypothetical protein JSU88_08110 [Nitrospinaceae bacterium]
MTVDPQNIMWAGFGVGLGVYWFFHGFRELKSSRIIQNTPTSRIATGAVGTDVEISGRVMCDRDKWVTAPISGRSAVFYAIEIEQLVRRKNSSHWVKIDEFFSDKGFYLDDDSGALALVMVEGAAIKKKKGRKVRFRMRSKDMATMPANLLLALTMNAGQLKSFKVKHGKWWDSREYRFIEWAITPDETIYVLGYADSGLRTVLKRKPKMATYLEAKKQIESDPDRHERFDRDEDGELSVEEVEAGAARLAVELESKYSEKQVEERVPKTKMVFKKQKGKPFFISNMAEADLIKHLSLMATLKLWGGPVVSVAGAAYILFVFSGQ